MRSSELHEALKRARMKTEVDSKNGKEQPKAKSEPKHEEGREDTEPKEFYLNSSSSDRATSPTPEKKPAKKPVKKPAKAKAPLNLDAGKNLFLTSVCWWTFTSSSLRQHAIQPLCVW